MCYDLSAKKRSITKQAKRLGYSENEIEALFNKSDLPLYHASGFSHPVIPILTGSEFIPAVWGLLPFWAKDQKIMNQTLNARSETMFEKNAFKKAAVNARCVVMVSGFFEHHHHKGKTYPFFIHRSDGEAMAFAGLYTNSKLNDESVLTFSIVTCKGNALMAKLHNNPKLSFGPRMPIILPDNSIDNWLLSDLPVSDVMAMAVPYPVDGLSYHTVNRLRGKAYSGNLPSILESFDYPELVYNFD